MVAELDGGGIEMEFTGWEDLLPCLDGGHGVVAEFIGEAADGVGGGIEGEGGVVVVIVWLLCQ